MKTMQNWSTRLKDRMKALKMTQEILAGKMGVTRGAITHYLSERRTPSLLQFKKLSAVLKTDPAWLQYGLSTTQEPKSKNEKSETKRYPLPILPWNTIADFIDTRKRSAEIEEWVPHFFTDQPHWYALRVTGDSMKAPTGNSKSFHEGDLIIVDPDKTAAHGSYVVAMLPRAKEATFKQYVVDGGVGYLKPLNPQYPMVPINDATHVCGVIVECLGAIS
jgi:SOS-response transcriptional repressor LexA